MRMVKRLAALGALLAACASLSGCIFLIGAGIGAAAVGVIVASGEDSAEVTLDRPPDAIREAAREILLERGVLREEGARRLVGELEGSKVVVRLSELQEGRTKVIVSARKTLDLVPNQTLAKEIARAIADAAMQPDYPHTV